jgi:hypothetical protein
LTTTGDLSACKSKRTLIQLLTVNIYVQVQIPCRIVPGSSIPIDADESAAAHRRVPPPARRRVHRSRRQPLDRDPADQIESTGRHTGQTVCALHVLLKNPSGFQFHKYALPPYENPYGLVLSFMLKPLNLVQLITLVF